METTFILAGVAAREANAIANVATRQYPSGRFATPSAVHSSASRKKGDEKVKEREKEKIALKEIEKEAPPPPASPACAREDLPAVIAVNKPPTLELLLAFAHLRCSFFDDEFTREWFRVMNDEYLWCYPETGAPIRHWPAYFRLWRVKRKLFEKINDPDRIPDARSSRGTSRKADDWFPTDQSQLTGAF